MSELNCNKSVSITDDWDFLKCIHKMLSDGNVLNTTGDKPIVTFKYPEELQVSKNAKFIVKKKIILFLRKGIQLLLY